MFWGLTPCIDLLDEIKIDETISGEINILLLGSADARHILKTLSRRYRHSNVKINFYIMEMALEVIAKQLLLLNIGLQPIEELGLVQKTRIFMEVFGNSLVRPSTSKYLTNKGKEFVEMITNLDHMKKIMPFIHIELKYKERDYIENVFKFWAGADEFDICTSWDRRLRKTLGVRYDCRKGVFDWDLHMRFHNIGGHQVCVQEYQSFRRNGLAFSWLECEVSKPNRSMVCGVLSNGDKYGHFGYLGDLQTGPFVAYGLHCEDEEFLKKTNNLNKYRSTDITERNLREIFHEIEYNNPYVHQTTTDVSLGHITTQFYETRVIDNFNNDVAKGKKVSKCINFENVTINFLSLNALPLMQHKEKYKDFFNAIYCCNNTSFWKYLVKDVIQQIIAPGGLLLVENQLFVLSHRDKELEDYMKQFMEKFDGLDMAVCPFDVLKDSYAKFILK